MAKKIINNIDNLVFSLLGLFFLTALFFVVVPMFLRNAKRKYPGKKRALYFYPSSIDIMEKGRFHSLYDLQGRLGGYFEKAYTIFQNDLSAEDRTVFICENHMVREFTKRPIDMFHRIGFKKINSFICDIRMLYILYLLIRREDISTIISYDPHKSGLYALVLSRLTGVSYIIFVILNYDEVHAATGEFEMGFLRFRIFEEAMERVIFRAANMVFAPVESYMQYAIDHGATPGKTYFVHHFVDTQYYRTEEYSTGEAKERLGINDRKVVLIVGRLVPQKHFDDVIRCFKEVATNHRDAMLYIVGEGCLRSSLEALTEDLGLKARIKFVGFQSQEKVSQFIKAADVCIYTQGIGILMEFGLSARPIVAYKIEGSEDIIVDRETGRLIPFREYQMMAKAVNELLENPTDAAQMGRKVRDLVLSKHTPEKAIQARICSFEKLFKGNLHG